MNPLYDKGRYAHYKQEETGCYLNQKQSTTTTYEHEKRAWKKTQETFVLVVYMRKQGRVEEDWNIFNTMSSFYVFNWFPCSAAIIKEEVTLQKTQKMSIFFILPGYLWCWNGNNFTTTW